MGRDREAPTHAVFASSTAEVAFVFPNNAIAPGEDRVVARFNDQTVLLGRGDWQTFVANVKRAESQVEDIFNVAGRRIGQQQ